MKSASRMRRLRARRAAGRRIVRAEVDELALEATLIELGHLDPLRADDVQAIERALSALLAKICAAYVP